MLPETVESISWGKAGVEDLAEVVKAEVYDGAHNGSTPVHPRTTLVQLKLQSPFKTGGKVWIDDLSLVISNTTGGGGGAAAATTTRW